MATQPIIPPSVPPGMKPIAPQAVPSAPGKSGPTPAGVPQPKLDAKAPGGPQTKDGQPKPGEEELPEHPHPIGFWQQPWVQNVLPFVTSISIHAAILILGLLVWGVAAVVKAMPNQDQTIIPESTLAENGPPGGVPNVGPGGDPNRQALQDQDPNAGTKEGFSDKQSPSLDVTKAGGGAGDDASVFADGPLAGLGSGKGAGGGHGPGSGSGSGDGGGPMAMFGTPGGGGIGPKGPVFGNGGNAHQIVFLCDGTGSMLNKMATLKDELTKAVGGLKPIQSFDIVFFQDIKAPVKFADSLAPATPEAKRKAAAFLDGLTAEGVTDPIPALELALKLHPQLLYFLTDAADFPDPKAVIDTINKFNKDRSIHINTILFVEDKTERDKNADSEGLMSQISKENGGKFRWVEMDAIQH